MKRAAVLIGVDKTGSLPKLHDAASGARKMAQWAQQQGFDSIEVITDEGTEPVIARDIKKAIKAIVEAGTIEQLVVYFAGHGVNNAYSEYWLLSEAPGDPQEAVNLQGSETLARYAGIPHVVFISDACRTAAPGIQAQAVRGSEIFPNEGPGGAAQPVDLFYACSLGNPAAEIDDPNTTAEEYAALYTGALRSALLGEDPSLLEWADDRSAAFIRPRPLKKHLFDEIQDRIRDMDLVTEVMQSPDAILVSPVDAWLSRLTQDDLALPQAANGGGGPPVAPPSRGVTRSGGARGPRRESAAAISTAVLHSAVRGDAESLLESADTSRDLDDDGASDLLLSARRTAEPFGPMHHETECGFKVRGARFVDVVSRAAFVELASDSGDDVRAHPGDNPGASVLLVFEGGTGVVLPAVPGFLGALTVENGSLVDVAFEPSDNTGRWQAFQERAPEIRALRAIASSSMSRGVFRLEGEDAFETARRMQYAKSVDPTLAIYAAYAYHGLHMNDRIRDMGGYLRADIGAAFFDIAMLGGDLDGRRVVPDGSVYSSMPLLAQGWALLSAFRVSLLPSVAELRGHLVPSMWTMLNPTGVDAAREAFQMGEL